MLDTAFIYSYGQDKWVECVDPAIVKREIEDVPYVLLVKYTGNTYYRDADVEYVFCPKHNMMEKVVSISDNRVVSEEGCSFEGLLGLVAINLDDYFYYRRAPHFIPYRWRIYQSAPLKYVNVACDVLKVQADQIYVITKWLNCSLSFDVIKDKILVSKNLDTKAFGTNWIESDIDIPGVVVETAIEAMGESTRYVTGIRPSVLCQIKNKKTLMGYMERPFDVNIVFLKKFFQEFIHRDGNDIFDEIFGRDEKDNYKIICDLLEIKPHKSLRKAYAFNPYAIVWYMIFKQWDIKDVNYMHKFFYLDQCIASLPLCDFYYDKNESHVTTEHTNRWEALDFYCRWVLEQKGEKRILKWLYHVSTEASLTGEQWDTLFAFHDHFFHLSEVVKAHLLKDGLTSYVHDAISEEVIALSEDWASIKLLYTKREQAYGCRINEYEFRLLPNTGMLPVLGSAFHNCVASYRDRVIKHQSVIVYVIKNEEYLVCIELRDGNHIQQASGKCNKRLKKEVSDVCYFWAHHNNLIINTNFILPLSPDDLKRFDDVVVEPIPYGSYVDERNLEDLLNLEEDKIGEGYYLRLEELLGNLNKELLSVPPGMEFSDEASMLTYLLPEGERIFKAAYLCNAEAAMVLGVMYFKGNVIHQDLDKALKWLNISVGLGNKVAAEKIKQVFNARRGLVISDALANIRRLLADDAY